ncbi:MAG TPA: ArgE/DapE family deacylase [Chloroflexota bacterium]|nr:ArgE/DapE family deacylase [Chloroflexota bacterium]
MDEQNIRLMELQPGRSWDRPRSPIPPLEQTEREIEQRLAAVAPQRERVFAAIDAMRDRIVACLQGLVRIPSVNPGDFPTPDDRFEKDLADHVSGEMLALGMEVRQIEPAPRRTSVLGRRRGTAGDRSLLFYAHLDTVPFGDPAEWTYPPLSATLADGKVWGRGAKDCKLGLAAALTALRAFEDAEIRLAGDLQIVAPADEEMGGQWGIAQMIAQDMIKADWAIYGEGMPDFITIGHRGMMNLKITTHGVTAHTARKHLGQNAILKMCRLAPRIDAIEFTRWQPHPVVPAGPVASANVVRGGFKENVVPDRCSLTVDVRFPPGCHHQPLVDEVRAAIEQAQREFPYLGEVDLELVNIARPSFVDPDEPLVRYMQRVASEVQGRQVEARGMLATSDSRWILLDAGIPVVNFSMGNVSGHRPNEWAGVEDLIANTKIYALIALALLGPDHARRTRS